MYPLTFPCHIGRFSSLHAICKFYCRFFETVILIDVKWYLIGQLNCLSLRTSEAEHFFLHFMAISVSSLEKCAFRSLAIFYWIVCFLTLMHKFFVCIGDKFPVGIFVCRKTSTSALLTTLQFSETSSRKTFTSASLTMPKLLTVWITANCGKF